MRITAKMSKVPLVFYKLGGTLLPALLQRLEGCRLPKAMRPETMFLNTVVSEMLVSIFVFKKILLIIFGKSWESIR
ncbi:hypothetical protein BD408DRAFT_471700, partial [Parasitella parasitica]